MEIPISNIEIRNEDQRSEKKATAIDPMFVMLIGIEICFRIPVSNFEFLGLA